MSISENVNIKYLTELAQKGIDLTKGQVDYSVLKAWQNYVITVLQTVSTNTSINFLNGYMQLQLSIITFTPKEQIIRTVEFVIVVLKRLQNVYER